MHSGICSPSKLPAFACHSSESWNPATAPSHPTAVSGEGWGEGEVLQAVTRIVVRQKPDSSFRWNDEQGRCGFGKVSRPVAFAVGGLALLIGLDAHAAATAVTTSTAIPTLTVAQVGSQSISLPLQILALMSAITLLPAILLSTTAFTRVVIVFGLLRQALGTGQTPSNQILIGLSLFLTALIMAPVAEQAWTNGIAPYMDGKLDFNGAWQGIVTPLRTFMLAQVRDNDLLTFAGLSGAGSFASPAGS